ncbi:MAG TPA: hypothetical protein VJL58_10515 [Pyrinomonadaceae bacterium]|nr:hypothetical protein [Pyrinomonadaceae bacterium]
MTSITKDWIVVILFALSFFVLTIAEITWLNRKGWTSTAKAIAFPVLTNLLSFGVGTIVFFVVFGVMFAMAWDGSIERAPGGDTSLWALTAFGVLFTPVFLILVKRSFLTFLKIETGSPWLFSVVSSILFLTGSLGIPIAFALLF